MRNIFENYCVEEKENKGKVYDIILEYGETLEAPDPRHFMHIYHGKENPIGKDLNKLRLTKKGIEKSNSGLGETEKRIMEENKKRGRCFEIVLGDRIHQGEWLGKDVKTSRTSEYDDVINGVDMVIEFDKERPERMAIAVDASTSSNVKVIEEKIRRNIEKIRKKKDMQEVKYFNSQIKDANGEYYQGSLKNLIPVVVGADKNNVDNLFDTFAELKSLEEDKGGFVEEWKNDLIKKLNKDPLQGVFLKEIKIQLETYKSIIGEENKEFIDQCESLLKIINEVIEEKEKEGIYFKEAVPSDQTFNNIIDVCKEIA